MPMFVETYCATVVPKDCDRIGHMNVQHYFAAVIRDGMFAIMGRLGITPEEIRSCARRPIFIASCAPAKLSPLGPCRKAWREAATFQQATKQLRSATVVYAASKIRALDPTP
jgi:hypothetical protein